MKQAHFKQPSRINAERLLEEMAAVLGAKYVSMDTGVKRDRNDTEKHILVRVSDDASEADTALVEAVIAAHNPDVLSKEQQRLQDRANAHTRLIGFDFEVLRSLKPAEQNPVIIELLEDIQKLLRGVE